MTDAAMVRKYRDQAEQAIRRQGWNLGVVTISADHLQQILDAAKALHDVCVEYDVHAPLPHNGKPSQLRLDLREAVRKYEQFDKGATT